MGYTYDKDGTISALTRQEERRLLTGRMIWNRIEEAQRKKQQGDSSGASAHDHREFEKFAAEKADKGIH